jgi:hypothetical protein
MKKAHSPLAAAIVGKAEFPHPEATKPEPTQSRSLFGRLFQKRPEPKPDSAESFRRAIGDALAAHQLDDRAAANVLDVYAAWLRQRWVFTTRADRSVF